MKATIHLQGVEAERKAKGKKKPLILCPSLDEGDQFNRNRQKQANAEVFNFFFVFLIDIKQIFSINN